VTGPHFQGLVAVRVKGCDPSTPYFEGKSRKFSVQVQGQFLHEGICADDIEFGAVFDSPLQLPRGTQLGLSLAQRINPALRADLAGQRPWLMSPLLCAMNRMKVSEGPTKWTYGGTHRLEEDSALVLPDRLKASTGISESKRRRFFETEENRKQTLMQPELLYDWEFLSSLVDFSNFEITLGMHIGFLPYLNGQPVRFEARLRGTDPPEVLFGVIFDANKKSE